MSGLAGYEIEDLVGRGATGTVHRARRQDWTGRLVAVKRVAGAGASQLADQLRREAEVLLALDHPHIVPVLEVVPDGDGVAIAMQYATGGSLADLLAVRGRLAPGEVVGVAAPVADALASAHRQGVLHCDVKPANVLLTSDGEPLLSDFGLARWLSAASTGGGGGGTPGYIDPAVAAGAEHDARSDVYSLGAVCYEMLTGSPPSGLTAPNRRPLAEAVPEAPPALVAAVERALSHRPTHRFADAAALAAALRAAVGASALPRPAPGGAGEGRHAPTRSFGPRPPRRSSASPGPAARRRPAMAAVAASVLSLAVGVALLVHWQRAPDAAEAAVAGPTGCAPPAEPLRGDLDGDGCPTAVSWEGNVLHVGGRRYRLGGPGDHLLLGDWDCDGRDTAALYRPGTGEVFLFDGWAGADQPLPPARRERLAAGGTAAAVGRGGCDRVVVEHQTP